MKVPSRLPSERRRVLCGYDIDLHETIGTLQNIGSSESNFYPVCGMQIGLLTDINLAEFDLGCERLSYSYFPLEWTLLENYGPPIGC